MSDIDFFVMVKDGGLVTDDRPRGIITYIERIATHFIDLYSHKKDAYTKSNEIDYLKEYIAILEDVLTMLSVYKADLNLDRLKKYYKSVTSKDFELKNSTADYLKALAKERGVKINEMLILKEVVNA
jgi:hypothetical protein